MEPTTKFSQRGGWNSDLLKEYLDARLQELDNRVIALMNERDRRYEQRFEAQQAALQTALIAQEKAVVAALAASDRAVNKSDEAASKRFESVNEFRQQLNDQASTFMPRNEAIQLAGANRDKIDTLQTRLDRLEGTRTGVKDSGAVLFSIVLAIGSVVAAVIAIITALH